MSRSGHLCAWRWPAALVLLASGTVVPLGAAPDARPIASTSENPHGRADRCEACHVAGPGDGRPGPALPVVETCRACHPFADMHRVGMPPGEESRVPADWPLEAGLLVCSTCHGEPSHEPDLLAVPRFHRGGPYADESGLCFQCHESAEFVRKDPHHPSQVRGAADGTCAACHSGLPQAGAPPEASRLRLPSDELCEFCHRGAVHAGADEHLGKEVDAAVAATLPDAVRLDPGRRIACWTCHEVHGDGAAGASRDRNASERRMAGEFRERALQSDWSGRIPRGSHWPGDAAARPGHPALLALSVEDDALCRACHGEGPDAASAPR